MKRLALFALATLAGCGSQPAPETAATPSAPTFKQERKFLYPASFREGRPFMPGVMAGQTLYLAGQVGADPMTGEIPEGIEAQTRRAMENVGLILKEAGLTFSNLVSCHVQLVDMGEYAKMNEVYGSFYEAGKYPARTTLQIAALGGANRVEVTCTAYAGETEAVRPAEGSTPAAMGPYSPAVKAGKTVYVSGQGGREPGTNALAPTAGGQTERTLKTIGAILEAAGLGMKNVAFSNVYYPDAADWAQIEQAYKAPLAEGSAPSLGAFHLAALPGGIKVEITFIAAADDYITRLYPAGQSADGLASPASLTGGTLYLSSVTKPGATLEEQMRAIMAEHEARLKLAGMGFAHVTNANVYMADMGDFDAMNTVFREYFGANPPARTTVGIHFTKGEKLAIALTAVE